MYKVLNRPRIVHVQEQLNDKDSDRNDNKNRSAMEEHAKEVLDCMLQAELRRKPRRTCG